MEPTKFLLDEDALPGSWCNVVPNLPFGLEPPRTPAAWEPVGPEVFSEMFQEEVVDQKMTAEPYIPIPRRCARSTRFGARHLFCTPGAWRRPSTPLPYLL